MGAIYLSSSAVNSGTPVNMGSTDIEIGINKFVGSLDVIGIHPTDGVTQNPDCIGFSNQMMKIKGNYNINDNVSNFISHNLLLSFVRTTSSIYIKDDVFFPTYTRVWITSLKTARNPRDGSQTSETNTQGSFIGYSLDLIQGE